MFCFIINSQYSVKVCNVFFKWANPGLFYVYFCPFLITISIKQIEKRVDGVLGIRTRGRRMVGADETMELWRPPKGPLCYMQPIFWLKPALQNF